MSTAEVVDAAPGPSAPLTGKALFRNLHTREFLGHKKKVGVLFLSVLVFFCAGISLSGWITILEFFIVGFFLNSEYFFVHFWSS